MNTLDRRAFLRAGLATAGLGAVAVACGSPRSPQARLIGSTDPRIGQVETARVTTGQTRAYTLNAVSGQVDLGGPVVTTWTYDGVLPGREIRVRTGDVIEARLVNQLPADATVHWHGLALRNDMDGAPEVTQAAIKPGETFTYRFTAEAPGTYWFHPHVGVHLDRGLYAPLIVDDPAEAAPYDQDWVVVLDDWIDGTGTTPDELFAQLRRGMGGMGSMPGMNGGMMTGAGSPLLGGDVGDVDYPYYLINGRVAQAPTVFTAKPRQRARIRFINAGGDTAFRVALGGHRMTVTHTDGFPINPVDTDALLIGMGERYDVLVTLGDGKFPLVALAEGKNDTALAVVSTGASTVPSPETRPRELDGTVVRYDALRPAVPVALPAKATDVEHKIKLTGTMMAYDWGFDGHAVDLGSPWRIREGQRVRVSFTNATTMYHPCTSTGTRSRSTAAARARTPRSCCPARRSPVISTPTTPGSG